MNSPAVVVAERAEEQSPGASSFQEKWGDRLNPLVVKEVRQGLRTRVFWVCFGLMLAACVVLSLIAFVETRDAAFTQHGQGFFLAYFTCLSVVHFIVIPYSAYRSLAREREDETWVLLVLTGLGPRKILRGKMTSFLVQAGLYASAVGPFLLFSYYLNGISLPTILLVLGLGGAWLLFLTVVAVCAATLADSRMGRALIHFVVLGALAVGWGSVMISTGVWLESGSRLLQLKELTRSVGTGLVWMLAEGWLLFEVAASRLSLSTENYTRGPRRAVVGQLVVALVGGLLLWWDSGFEPDVAGIFGVIGALHLGLVCLFVATDVDGQARALRPATRFYSLFRPGALRGFRLTVLLLVGWCAVWLGIEWAWDDGLTKTLIGRMLTVVMPAYVLLYLSLGIVVGRMGSSDRFSSPASVRVLIVLLVGLGSGVPPLVAAFLGVDTAHVDLNLLNPVVGMNLFSSTDYEDGVSHTLMSWRQVGIVVAVSLIMAFLADRVLSAREKWAHRS
ncbi:ABC transporter permease [Myxococcus stipitatus]|uniref:ABC transporter permease n=1 Tax=Myxococcus stipitatus TaxID=83455 RepID=UPI003145595D